MPAWFADVALLPSGPARAVRLDVTDGRFAAVTVDASPAGAERLPGVVLPGFANGHSHAFHRALRGRTHDDGGTFWTWREAMYAVAQRLDPDSYLALARATYAEMALAGVTAVGEFHYVHHGPGGVPYDAPNAMGDALRQAARDAGIRLTLLDVCYLAGGLTGSGHLDLDPVQQRFSDGTAEAWAVRAGTREDDTSTTLGVAAHSVRAVPAADLDVVVRAAGDGPRHVHLSEQPAENEACLAYYGTTPAAVLDAHGFLGPSATAVHATHLSAADIERLGTSRTHACFCPTTEQDLADGVGPARMLADAGSPIGLGSDQHATIDLLGEARALEMHERLITGHRGRVTPAELVTALTDHAALGVADAGRLEVGARADLVAVRLDDPATAGTDPAQIMLVATAANVDTVIVDGVPVVRGGHHRLGDVGRLLVDSVGPLWS